MQIAPRTHAGNVTMKKETLTWCGVEDVIFFPHQQAIGVVPPKAPANMFSRSAVRYISPGTSPVRREPQKQSSQRSKINVQNRVSWRDLVSVPIRDEEEIDSLDALSCSIAAPTVETRRAFSPICPSVPLPLLGAAGSRRDAAKWVDAPGRCGLRSGI